MTYDHESAEFCNIRDLQNRQENEILERSASFTADNSATLLLVLMRESTRLPERIELSPRRDMVNGDIETVT